MRNIWEGAISFGLIHIPIKLYGATKNRAPKLEYLRQGDLCRIGYVKVCKATGEEVPWDKIVKGYKYKEGDYVVLTDEDFKKASPVKTQVIEITDFVDEEDIDPMYFVKPYYVGPVHHSDKVYRLLLEAMKRSGKLGIGKFVMKSKEQLVALKAEKDFLVLNELRFPEEIKEPVDDVTPKTSELSEQELGMAIKLIEKMSVPFKPQKYHDTYTDELEEIIEAKAKGKTPKIKKVKISKATKVPDLMSTLRASLHATVKHRKKKSVTR